MKQKNQKGFTLIELIVVTTILTVLAAIAIPQYVSFKEKGEIASMVSDCRSLYRAFVIFYLEHEEYPYALTANEFLFDKQTFKPLTVSGLMGGVPFDISIEGFWDRLSGREAEKFDSPDDTLGSNQEFYVVLPWAKDPTIKFVVAASDNVVYADGTSVDGGNWIDGVYITRGGTIIGP